MKSQRNATATNDEFYKSTQVFTEDNISIFKRSSIVCGGVGQCSEQDRDRCIPTRGVEVVKERHISLHSSR